MFKKVSPNFRLASSGNGSYITAVTNEVVVDGLKQHDVRIGSASELFEELPPPSNFSLKAQLDAGVDLQFVDSRLLAASEINTVRAISKLNQKIDNQNETSEN